MKPPQYASAERRRGPRVPLKLRGRCMLSDGVEHPCETIDLSVHGLLLSAYVTPEIGERVVAYIDQLGRVEGFAKRRGPDWFAVETHATPQKLERIARKLAEISDGQVGPVISAAAEPQTRSVELRTEFGQSFTVEARDETALEARVVTKIPLLPGARLRFDGRYAVVLRQTTDGFVVCFPDHSNLKRGA